MKRILTILLALLTLCTLTALAESADDGTVRPDLTALEVTRLMGNGTNLGNTLEACDNTRGYVAGTAPTVYETSWGQPVTTPEMLTALKAAGFDTIRIPVAWMTNATSLSAGDPTIDPAYLDRVQEVVDYARAAGMYVIINDHWDGGWWGMFGSESESTRAFAMEAYIRMWQQIAARFADYSDYVIFESANEELGARFDEDSPLYCSDSVVTYLEDDARYALCNEVNQAFVDTVRASGGNNAQRFLLIAGYGTNIDQTCDDRFQMPTDSAKDRLLVSVHYYDPWSYCGASSAAGATAWGTKSDYAYMDEQLAKMTKFTAQGVGVVIGEYGALPGADGEMKANALAYHTRFLDLCAAYDLTSCLWDCSGFFVRRDLSFADADLAALYLNRAAEADADYAQVQSAAKARLSAAMDEAPDTFLENAIQVTDDTAVAWLMWNDGGWALSYSVGDTYTPDSVSPGMVVTDVEITGEGTYTVGIDFTGTQQGYSASVAFAAIGIANGEALYHNYIIDIKEVLINGERYNLKGRAYTTSDNGLTTRVNLFNEWVKSIPVGTARMHHGNLAGATPTPIDRNDAAIAQIKTIYITFEYSPMK